MCGLPLRSSSVEVIFLDTKPASLRKRLLLPSGVLNKRDDNSCDIFVQNVFDRYVNRPETLKFNDMCLYDFISNYVSTKTSTCTTQLGRDRYKLMNDLGFIYPKNTPAVIRTPRLSKEIHGDLYYMSLLITYFPWRQEADLTYGFDNAQQSFVNKCISHPTLQNKFAAVIEEAVHEIQLLNDIVMKDYVGPVVAPNIEAVEAELESILPINNSCDDHAIFDIGNEEIINATNQIYNTEEASHHISCGIQEGDDILAMTSSSISDAKFSEMVNSLNSGQASVFEYVKTNIFKHKFHIFICGPGGTGKSYLIKIIKEYIHRLSKSTNATVTTAPTGVAAFNIQGVTIHRALNLPIQHKGSSKYQALNGDKLDSLRKYWHHVNTLIIDEISMVSYETFLHIHLRLNEIMGIEDPTIFFGGLNVIVLGDFYQLPPVHGKFIFDQCVSTAMGTHLWRDLFIMLELEQVERQKDDANFRNVLSRFRIGEQTDCDISQLLTSVDPICSNINNQNDTLYLYPTIDQCDKHNLKMLQVISKYKPAYSIKAEHTKFCGGKSKKISEFCTKLTDQSLIPNDDRECAGLAKELNLSVNSIIILRRNINTSDGLVNGARGIVKSIIWNNSSDPCITSSSMPKCIFVDFFDKNVGVETKKFSSMPYVELKLMSAIFFGKRVAILQRTQLPICLCWASTIHKVQGLTMKSAVVDLGQKVFSSGMAYVALSRVTSMRGLHLLDFHPKSLIVSDEVQKEMERFRLKNITK
jgi:energy-coupling factor transporter ATP-binding protein EcfA2